MLQLEQLIKCLGVKGAIAGLTESDYTNKELLELLTEYLDKSAFKAKRTDLIATAVYNARKKSFKSNDELISMSTDELESYFKSIRITKDELQKILSELDVRPINQSLEGMMKYVISEINEIGMYKRVAQGDRNN
ncbi:hypothetical protein [Aeromonas sp. 61P]|uniref:hypothetical protein n=1 Tax=Aeromonas sp. 61P TaxID=3452721 RepID=UPI003F79958F